jgi:hypothetical protein
LLLLIVVTLCGFLRPGYDHVTRFVSELGATGTSYAWLLNFGGFAPAGLLSVVASGVLCVSFTDNLPVKLGFGIVAACASTFIVAAFSPCDIGCPASGGSFSNVLHMKLTLLASVLITPTIAFIGLQFRRLPKWKSLALYSIATGVVAFVLIAAMMSTMNSRAGAGVFQRLHFGVCFLWLAVVANQFRRIEA